MINDKEKFENANVKLFERVARWYDGKINRTLFFESAYRKIIQLLQDECGDVFRSDARVVDIACGTGEIIFRLANKYPQAKFIGIDFTDEMLKKTKDKTAGLNNVELQKANVEKLPFADCSVDLIICSDAFHHFYNPEQALAECHRVLKSNGFLLLVDIALKNNLPMSLVAPIFKRIEHAKEYYSKKDLRQMLGACNFNIKSEFTYHLNNYFITERG